MIPRWSFLLCLAAVGQTPSPITCEHHCCVSAAAESTSHLQKPQDHEMLAQQRLTFYIDTSFKQQHIFKTGTNFDLKTSARKDFCTSESTLFATTVKSCILSVFLLSSFLDQADSC